MEDDDPGLLAKLTAGDGTVGEQRFMITGWLHTHPSGVEPVPSKKDVNMFYELASTEDTFGHGTVMPDGVMVIC